MEYFQLKCHEREKGERETRDGGEKELKKIESTKPHFTQVSVT